jgi:hypothetical protein
MSIMIDFPRLCVKDEPKGFRQKQLNRDEMAIMPDGRRKRGRGKIRGVRQEMT